MGKQVVGYVRVSTVGQADQGCSLVLQREKIHAYCKLHDLELIQTYEDAGRSAKDIKGRPAFQECLEVLARKQADGLVVYKLDRAFRSTTDCLETVEMLRKKDLEFISITENVSTGGAIGTLFISILASLSAFERQLTAERTSQALQGKIARGERTGSIPFGWTVADDQIHLIKYEPEQDVIRKMKWYQSRNYSAGKIAKTLNESAIPTKHNGTWQAKQVLEILRRA